MPQEIRVAGTRYVVLDTIERMTLADSFVSPANKIGTAHGERKFYIGNDNAELHGFWGDRGFVNRCIVQRIDLLQYLSDAQLEYFYPTQEYRSRAKMRDLWSERRTWVEQLPEVIHFTAEDQTQIRGSRVYINSEDANYSVIGEVALPKVSYLSIKKLRDDHGSITYYLKPFVDFSTRPNIVLEDSEAEDFLDERDIPPRERLALLKARLGQGAYREKLLKQCSKCPITLISDPRILVASHIKPWASSTDREKIDPKNGFMFTPTFDALFDKGLISFTNDQCLMISAWLAEETCQKLRIAHGTRYPELQVNGRLGYLDYHRDVKFKRL